MRHTKKQKAITEKKSVSSFFITTPQAPLRVPYSVPPGSCHRGQACVIALLSNISGEYNVKVVTVVGLTLQANQSTNNYSALYNLIDELNRRAQA